MRPNMTYKAFTYQVWIGDDDKQTIEKKKKQMREIHVYLQWEMMQYN